MELSLTEHDVHNINDFFDYISSKILFDGNLPAELQDKLTTHLLEVKTSHQHKLGLTDPKADLYSLKKHRLHSERLSMLNPYCE